MTKTETVNIDYVEVPSGRFVNMNDPDPNDITLHDVAHKLSQMPRYGGSAAYPYWVSQHAVFVSERLRRQGHSKKVQLLGLHHDDPEAFLMDIPRPWKSRLGRVYKQMTATFEGAIGEALDLPIEHYTGIYHKIIKDADNFALLVEARQLLPSGGRRWDYLKELSGLPSRIITPDYFKGEMYWLDAMAAYLQRHEELTNG